MRSVLGKGKKKGSPSFRSIDSSVFQLELPSITPKPANFNSSVQPQTIRNIVAAQLLKQSDSLKKLSFYIPSVVERKSSREQFFTSPLSRIANQTLRKSKPNFKTAQSVLQNYEAMDSDAL